MLLGNQLLYGCSDCYLLSLQASDVSASLDALSKAATATAAADLACAGNPAKMEAMTAVKRVGEDGGFGDVDHIVRLVRLALEAIEH